MRPVIFIPFGAPCWQVSGDVADSALLAARLLANAKSRCFYVLKVG